LSKGADNVVAVVVFVVVVFGDRGWPLHVL